MRTAGQPADARRDRHLPPLSPERARLARSTPGRGRARQGRTRRLPRGGAHARSGRAPTGAPLRPRRGAPAAIGPRASLLVPPEPAEHLHGETDASDARRGLRTCAAVGRRAQLALPDVALAADAYAGGDHLDRRAQVAGAFIGVELLERRRVEAVEQRSL